MAEVTREITSAHYLHERTGLEAVVRPPVSEPTCLAWRPGTEQLLVGNRAGELFEVDPVMGTTRRAHGLGPVRTIAVHPDNRRYIALSSDRGFVVGELGGAELARGQHGLTRRMSAFWLQDYAIIVGDSGAGRAVLILRDGKVIRRIPVPHRAVPRVGADGKLGAFVETKNAQIGRGSKVPHLSYVGDAEIGEYSNIGAGTITCNYDGYDKHLTEIGANVFVGSNTALVAPVKVGEGASIAAGSVVTRNVPADALAIARPGLELREGWAARFRDMKAARKAARQK